MRPKSFGSFEKRAPVLKLSVINIAFFSNGHSFTAFTLITTPLCSRTYYYHGNMLLFSFQSNGYSKEQNSKLKSPFKEPQESNTQQFLSKRSHFNHLHLVSIFVCCCLIAGILSDIPLPDNFIPEVLSLLPKWNPASKENSYVLDKKGKHVTPNSTS